MRIAIANDHSAVEMKQHISEYLTKKGYEVVNFGTDNTKSSDYPIYAEKAARAVANGECDLGIVICGTGIGVSIVANKVKGIRCALCSESCSATLTRQHNNANMLAFGARIVGPVLAESIVDAFVSTPFSGEERHSRRIDMITKVENDETIG